TGLLREGDSADFIVIDNLENFTVLSTFIAGREVFGDGVVKFGYERVSAVNRFVCSSINTGDIITDVSGKRIRIIEAYDGLLNTGKREEIVHMPARTVHNTGDDILKIVVKERYNDAPPAVGFVKGFGLKHGAMASSVAHDSHNIIAVGTNDADIAGAVNRVVQMKGGLAWHCGPEEIFLPLEIAGIISAEPVAMVSQKYRNLTLRAVNAGSALRAPYMTLSFMALLVIPRLKIGDRGLFDVEEFGTVPLFVD
ncbi:MAG: adenine deaminase, partial [Bacteroidetes bacterium]|nr:adenine deaminase [Bacteroidota bacterium]